MNLILRAPTMTFEQFLDWVERQEEPYEFDGSVPVPMTGGSGRHSLLCSNLIYALRKRLDGAPYQVLPEAGVAMEANAVRYPDVLIAAAAERGSHRLIPEPIVVFEIASPASARTDHIVKVREYRAVASIRRYVILDQLGPDLLVYFRPEGVHDWTADAITAGDALRIPEVGIEVPVAELYEGVEFPPA